MRILALALLSTGSAAAQDAVDWSGPYAGLSFGRESGPQDYYYTGLSYVGTNDLSGNSDGLFAGYSFQFGNWVVGPEAEFSRADIAYAGNGFNHKQILDLRLRAGHAFGSTLAYVAAGYSASVWEEGTIEDLDARGYSLALGVEQRFGDNYFVGAEIIRHHLESDNFVYFPISRFETDLTGVRVRMGIKF